jgi:sec-independent protein translocase protein TatB
VVALFVLGPERLPTAATWLARTLRQIKTYASDTQQKMRSEIGPEFDQIRAPLDELRSDLTGWRTWRDPRTALLHHLRDDPTTPHHYPSPSDPWQPTTNPQPPLPAPQPLTPGQRPPFDPDAT